jgi:hypothetical protein
VKFQAGQNADQVKMPTTEDFTFTNDDYPAMFSILLFSDRLENLQSMDFYIFLNVEL